MNTNNRVAEIVVGASMATISALSRVTEPGHVAFMADPRVLSAIYRTNITADDPMIFGVAVDAGAIIMLRAISPMPEPCLRAALERAHVEAGPRGIVVLYLTTELQALVPCPFTPNKPDAFTPKWPNAFGASPVHAIS